MENILYVLTESLHLFKILVLCNLIFMFQKRANKAVMALSIIAMLVLSLMLHFFAGEITTFVVYVIALYVFLCVIYDEKLWELIIFSTWILFLISMLDLMSTQLINVLFDLFRYNNQNVEEFIASFISLLIILIAGKIYTRRYKVGIKNIGITKLFFFMVLAVADTFVVMILAGVSGHESLGRYRLSYIVSFFIVIIGIVIQLSSVILLIISRDTYREKDKITQKYLNEQIKHYKYLEQREQDTKKFRHDIKSHMQVLSTMAKDKKYSDFDEYMNEINVRINNFGNHITVNNGIVDAIINKYYSEAVRKGIHVEVMGMFPNICHVNAYDLCTIFSNVLSNAIEAAEKSAEKKITLVCRYTDTNIVVITKNTFKDEGQFAHSKIVSTKKDIEYHGFGIENIKEAVERNNGMLDIDIQHSNFSITIMLGNEEKENENCSSRRYGDVSQ